jgi:hypothetical protein
MRQTLNDVAAELANGDFIAERQVRKQNAYGGRALYYPFNQTSQEFSRLYRRRDELRSLAVIKPTNFYFTQNKDTKTA